MAINVDMEPGRRRSRRIGIRIWLAAAFVAVSLITAAAVFLFANNSAGSTLTQQASDLAFGRTSKLAEEISGLDQQQASEVVSDYAGEAFDVYVLDSNGETVAPPSASALIESVPGYRDAVATAEGGAGYRSQKGNETVVGVPIYSGTSVTGVVVTRSEPPAVLSRAFEDLRADRLKALAGAVGIGVLVGLLVSSLIAVRVQRLARAAERMAGGRFGTPLPPGGSDEIGDLSRSLDAMRQALSGSFTALATERDRLSAILEGLTDAVVVVGEEGMVRFSNPAAHQLSRDGQPAAALIPLLREASEHESAEDPALWIDESVFAVQARKVPAEHAVLVVARDRTEEFERERAERDFVSNAAHELRNPLAGISNTIEVLRGGAKDDPEARDRFLERLDTDVERMTRLTQSLLALASVEAGRERDTGEVVDVSLAARESLSAVNPPEGLELREEIEPGLVARGDPVLLRQVLIGLLSNAVKNTDPPGVVTIRALRAIGEEVRLEVEDTGKGIPAEDQPRVFERFYRSESARGVEGFGLGLAIAKRMVDLMGGEIGLRSEPGKGSLFWVRLRASEKASTPVA